MEYNHIFGPVPSRRLGISAGIDLIPYKTCSLNCVYCECGATTNITLKRKEYISAKKVIKEINDFLKSKPDLDYLTFSGSGEPTLNSKIGEISNFINKKYPEYNTCLLTNGTLFHRDKHLYQEIQTLDLIIPSLDAVSENIFQKINRGESSLKNKNIISGLIQLRKEFEKQIWLEIFILPGVNDTEAEIKKFKKTIQKIKPDKIQLNSLDRPGTEANLKKASHKKLQEIANYFSNKNTEIISGFEENKKNISDFRKKLKNNILETLKRRPCTPEDLAHMLGENISEINKLINYLLKNNKIQKRKGKRGNFYSVENKEQ